MISKVIKSRVLSVCLCSNRSLSRGRRIYGESETSPADPPGRRPVDHHRWTRGHLRSDSLPHCLTPSLKFQSTGKSERRWLNSNLIPWTTPSSPKMSFPRFSSSWAKFMNIYEVVKQSFLSPPSGVSALFLSAGSRPAAVPPLPRRSFFSCCLPRPKALYLTWDRNNPPVSFLVS